MGKRSLCEINVICLKISNQMLKKTVRINVSTISFSFFLQGKCKHCSKAFQSKLSLGSSKEVVGVSCSWCKYSYHNKDSCLKAKEADEKCDLGVHANAIVPPSWIVKVPR